MHDAVFEDSKPSVKYPGLAYNEPAKTYCFMQTGEFQLWAKFIPYDDQADLSSTLGTEDLSGGGGGGGGGGGIGGGAGGGAGAGGGGGGGGGGGTGGGAGGGTGGGTG